jgi:uncharacterized protein (DUF1330 family)
MYIVIDIEVTNPKAWLNSPEYAEARKLRHTYAKSNMLVVDSI